MSDTPRLLNQTEALDIGSTAGRLPLIVLTDNLNSWFAWRIRRHTNGSYNHAMTMIRPGYVASQNLFFGEQRLTDYIDAAHRVKFWRCLRHDDQDRVRIRAKVNADLRAPWRARMYDWVGILGFAVGRRSFNFQGRKYCSERVAEHFSLPNPHPSPADINRYCKEHPSDWECVGVWSPGE